MRRGVSFAVERLPQPRDVSLEGLDGCGRGRLAPQLVDQQVRRDDLIRVEEEDGEQGALLRTADLDPSTVVGDLERTEDPVLHPAPLRVVVRGLQPTVADPQPSRNRPATPSELMADLRRVMSMTRIWCAVAAVCAVALAAGVSPAHAAFPGKNGKIAFISDRHGGDLDIWTMNPNGHRLANLTATSNADELWPNWRADGRKIAFMSNPRDRCQSRRGLRALRDGRRRVTPGATHLQRAGRRTTRPGRRTGAGSPSSGTSIQSRARSTTTCSR